MLAEIDLSKDLASWRDDNNDDGRVVVLDAYREPKAAVLITQRGPRWYWSVADGDVIRSNGEAHSYDKAATDAGDWLKRRVH